MSRPLTTHRHFSIATLLGVTSIVAFMAAVYRVLPPAVAQNPIAFLVITLYLLVTGMPAFAACYILWTSVIEALSNRPMPRQDTVCTNSDDT